MKLWQASRATLVVANLLVLVIQDRRTEGIVKHYHSTNASNMQESPNGTKNLLSAVQGERQGKEKTKVLIEKKFKLLEQKG